MKKALSKISVVVVVLCFAFSDIAQTPSGGGGSPPGGDQNFCEICYDTDLCIPVPDGFGYSTCSPEQTRCMYIPLPNGSIRLLCFEVCKMSGPCVLPPQ
jgi:hypothetical protein